MSIPLLICWILAKMILPVDPAHIGNGIFDPLPPSSESSEGYLSNDMAFPILRTITPPDELRSLYDGYNFNHDKCIQFNNRILCGYNTNRGTRLDDYTMLDIGNGCRARGERIECGYSNPQHIKNLRHPKLQQHSNHNGDNHHYENQHQGNQDHDGNHQNGDRHPHGENDHHGLVHSYPEGIYPRQAIHHHKEKHPHTANQHHEENHPHDANQHHDANHPHVVNHQHEENHPQNSNQHHEGNHPHDANQHHEGNHPHDASQPQDANQHHKQNHPHYANQYDEENHSHVVNHQHEENSHHMSNHNPKENYHHEGNRGYQLEGYQVKLTPTRTAMPTDPTVLPGIFNRIKTDNLENKLLKSTLDILAIESKVPKIKRMKTTTKQKPSSTVTVEVTSTEPSTLTSKSADMPESRPTTKATTTLVAERSQSNDIPSSEEAGNKIVKLIPDKQQKRRQISNTFSTLPKLARKSILESTIASPIRKKCENRNSDAALGMKTSKEGKVKTACVEEGDRVVCYDFKI